MTQSSFSKSPPVEDGRLAALVQAFLLANREQAMSTQQRRDSRQRGDGEAKSSITCFNSSAFSHFFFFFKPALRSAHLDIFMLHFIQRGPSNPQAHLMRR